MTRETRAKAAALARMDKYERRHRQIIDAAAEVFAEQGYHGASTKDIAVKLGIRQASLYYYVPSKEALLEEVCEIGVEGFIHDFKAVTAGDAPVPDKIRAAIHNHLAPIQEKAAYVRVFLNCRKDLPKTSRHSIGRRARHYERLIEELLSDGVKSGALRADLNCRLATLALLGMCNAVSDWRRRYPSWSITEIADHLSDIFLSGICQP